MDPATKNGVARATSLTLAEVRVDWDVIDFG
jgi:hypothetical protein